jgi:hypothetical protein
LSCTKAARSFCQVYLPGPSLPIVRAQEYEVPYCYSRLTLISSVSLRCNKKRRESGVAVIL